MSRICLLVILLIFCFAVCAPQIFVASAHADLAGAEASLAKSDYIAAYKEFKTLSEQGNARAQYYLGSMYYFGVGITQDKAEAVKWYLKAAEQGDAEAQYELGHCYYEGEGVPGNVEEAMKWLRKADEQGYFFGEGG